MQYSQQLLLLSPGLLATLTPLIYSRAWITTSKLRRKQEGNCEQETITMLDTDPWAGTVMGNILKPCNKSTSMWHWNPTWQSCLWRLVTFKTHNRAEETSEQINISTTRKHLFTSQKTELGKDTDMPFSLGFSGTDSLCMNQPSVQRLVGDHQPRGGSLHLLSTTESLYLWGMATHYRTAWCPYLKLHSTMAQTDNPRKPRTVSFTLVPFILACLPNTYIDVDIPPHPPILWYELFWVMDFLIQFSTITPLSGYHFLPLLHRQTLSKVRVILLLSLYS